MIKKIFIILLILISFFFIVALFLPKKMDVQATMVLNASSEQIFPLINNLKNWQKWSPWIKGDSNINITYSSENPIGEGAFYKWKSQNFGEGIMKIVKSIENKAIYTNLDFGQRGTGQGYFKIEPTQTLEKNKLIWGFSSTTNNLIERYFYLILPKMLKKKFNMGLKDINQLLSQK